MLSWELGAWQQCGAFGIPRARGVHRLLRAGLLPWGWGRAAQTAPQRLLCRVSLLPAENILLGGGRLTGQWDKAGGVPGALRAARPRAGRENSQHRASAGAAAAAGLRAWPWPCRAVLLF